MDYHSIHGQDISNFSLSSPHRMPTVSAAQALQDLQSSSSKGISTGLRELDYALQNRDATGPPAEDDQIWSDGVERGKITEVYGPPGVGKTALGMQLAVNALRDNGRVVWVDAAHPLPGPRLEQFLSASPAPSAVQSSSSPVKPRTVTDLLSMLTYFSTPTLPHLIALLCHTTVSFPPPSTSLIVIDSLSTLISTTYPRNLDSISTPRKPGAASRNDPQQWAASRKWSVLQYLISSLQKLATLRNISIVILNQAVTKMQSGSGAMLVPAISSTAWDAGIATRVVLLRDWGWEGKQVRFAVVVKATAVLGGYQQQRAGKVVAFTIQKDSLTSVRLEVDLMPNPDVIISPLRSRKRKAVEIRDSEEEDDLEGSDEDYGWAEDDAGELPEPLSQWQGSEDILVRGPDDVEAHEGEAEEEVEDSEEDAGEDEVGLIPDGHALEDSFQQPEHQYG